MLKLREAQWRVFIDYARGQFVQRARGPARRDDALAHLSDSELDALLGQAVELADVHAIRGEGRVLRLAALMQRYDRLEVPWAQRVLAWDSEGEHKLAALEFYAEQELVEGVRGKP